MSYKLLPVQHVLVQPDVVSWLWRLIAGLSSWRPGFDPELFNAGFLVDKVVLGQFFSSLLRYPVVSAVLPALPTKSPMPDAICNFSNYKGR
jgi:hypothetical protein